MNGNERSVDVGVQESLKEMRRLAGKIKRRTSESLDEMKDLERKCQSNIDELKYQLSKELIEKANAPVSRAVSVLGLVLAAIVVVGSTFAWLTANNLKSTLQTLMTEKIEGWLSLSDDSSEASKTLDTYRTRALLDSYMIQLARRKSQNDAMVSLNFKAGDEKRLLSIIQSSSSDRQDFYDALRLLGVADGEWGIMGGDNDLGQQLAGLIRDPYYDSMRKLDILQVLSRDRNLLDVEAGYLKNESAPESFRYQSYQNLKGYPKGSIPGELAFGYAIGLLKTSKISYKLDDALEYIASVEASNPDLEAFLDTLQERQRELRMDYRLAVAKGLIAQLPSPNSPSFGEPMDSEPVDRGMIRSKVAQLMSSLLDDGLMLKVDENFSGRPYLKVVYTQASGVGTSKQFPLDRLLEDQLLIQEIYKRQYPKGLDRFVRFFSTVDRGEIVTLPKLTVSTKSLGGGHDPSLPKDIVGRLEFDQDGKLKFAWRDSLGDWQTSSIQTLSDATVNITFDKNYIFNRDMTLTDWIF